MILLQTVHVSAQETEDDEMSPRKSNGLQLFHEYSIEHAFAEHDRYQDLRAKTALSTMPFFGIGIKKETPFLVFAFSSRFGFQRDNMTFYYQGQKLAGTYAMDYMSVKRQFALGIRLSPQRTFSFLVMSSYNIYGMGATPFGDKVNLRSLLAKDRLVIGSNVDSERGSLDFRLGFEYEWRPSIERKFRMFVHAEASLTQRCLKVEPNYYLGITRPYELYYRFYNLGYGFRF